MLLELVCGFGLGWIARELVPLDLLRGATTSPTLLQDAPPPPAAGEQPAPPILSGEDSEPPAVEQGEYVGTGGDPLDDPDGRALAGLVTHLEQLWRADGQAPPNPDTLRSHAAAILRGESVE